MSDQTLPRQVSPDEVELMKKYRDLAMPAARLAGLDDFAKWLFTSITVVGSLAAAFSTTALKSLDAVGTGCFFVAIFLTGLSLFLAVLLRAVEPAPASYYNLQDMLEKDRRALRTKQALARSAGGAFALAVLAAGCAPLTSLVFPSVGTSALSYSFGKDGIKVIASFPNSRNTVSEIRVVAIEPSKETVLAAQRGNAGPDKVVRMEITGVVPPASTSLRIQGRCDITKETEQILSIELQPPGTSLPGTTKLDPCIK
jgi:hypothetical protein